MSRHTRTLRPGEKLGRYSLSTRLARGGMGEVWLAAARGQGGFEKRLVLKTILPECASSPLFVKMFAEEARLTARLNHPNLIDVYDFAEDRGIYFLAMEYLPGRNLFQIIKAARERAELVPDWFILRVLADCCRGLHHAHERSKILHCDLSPSNVMVGFAGLTKIVDFGVAQTRHGIRAGASLNGKYAYMAPERIQQRPADCRSDVYSLGVIMYLAFAGRLPFHGDSDKELLTNILAGAAPPPGRLSPTAPDVDAVIMRAMAGNPDDRFQSADALGGAIESLLARRRGLCLESDIAAYLTALFADAPEVPADAGDPAARAPAARALARPRADSRSPHDAAPIPARAAGERGGSWEIDILLDDDSAISVVEAPEPCRPLPPPLPPPNSEAADVSPHRDVGGADAESDTRVTRVQQLFEASVGSRVDLGHAAATKTGAPPLFVALAQGTRSEAASRVGRWIATGRPRGGVFDGYGRRRDVGAEPWPWANNVKKTEEG